MGTGALTVRGLRMCGTNEFHLHCDLLGGRRGALPTWLVRCCCLIQRANRPEATGGEPGGAWHFMADQLRDVRFVVKPWVFDS
ncbi:hypothetical protein ACFQZC_25020 [Streptacidiphilus monticola]